MTLSRPAEDAVDDLGKFFESSNETLLSKGAGPEGGARVVSWTLEGDRLGLEIESEGPIRAHDALLRLKNGIGRSLGKRLKMGVRKSRIAEYDIIFPVDRAPLTDVNIPFAESVTFEGGECTMKLLDVPENFIRENYIDRMIRLIREKCNAQHYEGKGEHWELLWRSPERELSYVRDPTEEMLEKKWLKQGPTKGKWFLRPPAAHILRTMENIAVREVLHPLGFQEVIASHIVPFDVWLKTGHMSGSPNELYYVSEPATRDTGSWERFMDLVKITGSVPDDELRALVSPPRAGICYAQCPVVYWSFRGETISDESLPVLLYDRTANSCRYESGGRHGIERVDEFHRLEPVYIGTQEQMVELRERMLERYSYVFNEILELEWRMAWVTPFYMQQSGAFGLDDDGERIRGTIDFESYMPYRGDREKSEWLEFQNFSIVGDKYTRAFNIKCQTHELWSGCSGIGLERWSAAFLAQKGLDPEGWPEAFRKRVGDMPKGFELL